MQIIKSPSETATGPSDWFTGAVYIDAVAAPPAPTGETRTRPTQTRPRALLIRKRSLVRLQIAHC
jgi:hypothetical protein